MITPGAFSFTNIFTIPLVLWLVSHFFGPGKHLAVVGLLLIVYYWASLWWYSRWFMWRAPLENATETNVRAIIDEWTSGGPFGRTTRHLTRVMMSSDEEAKVKARQRMISLYAALVRLCPDDKRAAEELERLRRN